MLLQDLLILLLFVLKRVLYVLKREIERERESYTPYFFKKIMCLVEFQSKRIFFGRYLSSGVRNGVEYFNFSFLRRRVADSFNFVLNWKVFTVTPCHMYVTDKVWDFGEALQYALNCILTLIYQTRCVPKKVIETRVISLRSISHYYSMEY